MAVAITCGCDTYDDVRIREDDLPKVRVGETFEHQFEVTRPADDAWFIDCRHSNEVENPKMEMSVDGKLTFAPTAPGEQKLCIEYRRRQGQIHRIEPRVTVEHRKGESPRELWAALAAFRPKLARAHEAVFKIAKPRPTPCPGDLPAGVAHVYEEAWLTSIVSGQPIPKDARNTSAFRPVGYALWERGEEGMQPNLKEGIALVTSPAYVIAVRIADLTLPFLAPGDKFTMGRYRGDAVVVDLESGEVKCAIPVAFQSSTTVEFTETIRKNPDGTEASTNPLEGMDAVSRDFAVNGRMALEKAVKQAAPALEVTFGL